jgi:hypothetical protein
MVNSKVEGICMAKKKTNRKSRKSRKSAAAKKVQAKTAIKTKAPGKKKANKAKPRPADRKLRGRPNEAELVSYGQRGLGARSAGQAGDTQGIAAGADVDSESVEELLEEGQSFEAELVDAVENAPEPDQGSVRTREVSEDDVPEEYREHD